MVDTSTDLRVRFYEALVATLERYARSAAVRDKEGVLPRLASLFKEIRYSYLDPADIVSIYGPRVEELASRLAGLPASSEAARRLRDYVVEELRDFCRKFSRPVTRPYEVFRYAIVEIVGVSRHPELGRLLITRVRGGSGRTYTVVTNLPVKEGARAAVVFLPPREFDGVWSEAMFVKVGISGPGDVQQSDLEQINAYFHGVVSSK